MTDNQEELQSEKEPKEPEYKEIMSIILTKDGRVGVIGQITSDKMASYGILEMAKEAIQIHHEMLSKKAKSSLIHVPQRVVDFVRGGGGKVG